MEINELIKIAETYYPKGIPLNDPELFTHDLFIKFKTLCLEANKDQNQWLALKEDVDSKLAIEMTEFVLLSEFNPSFIAVFLTGNYERPKPKSYEPCQLVLKISILAPVYIMYFDNLVSDWNKRLIRSNPVTKREISVYEEVQEIVTKLYHDYSHLDLSMAFHVLSHLGDTSILNKRKPYLDECIFGLYLSIHPHNILTDKFEKR